MKCVKWKIFLMYKRFYNFVAKVFILSDIDKSEAGNNGYSLIQSVTLSTPRSVQQSCQHAVWDTACSGNVCNCKS